MSNARWWLRQARVYAVFWLYAVPAGVAFLAYECAARPREVFR